MELQDRVFSTTERQAFATIKDHKENFETNTKVRLINPSRPEIGKVAKKILEKVIVIVRHKTKLQQMKNTTAVINWFKAIKNKGSQKFIKFDVVNFYPTISEELLQLAINWAREYVDISEEEEKIIFEAKNSLLFKDGTPWCKKGESVFDVAQGSYDGAETCDLVGLFLLSKLEKIEKFNHIIYRDDGLGVTHSAPR